MPPTLSPRATGTQRKFINPTPGYVGANIFGVDGKPTAIAVEPGGEVWLTEEEERMTAEAPRSAADNPFIARWDEPVSWDEHGHPLAHVPRQGSLVLSDEPPRPVASDRFIPGRNGDAPVPSAPIPEGMTMVDQDTLDRLRAFEAAQAERREPPPAEETQTGAPPLPEQPPVQGQPSPAEVVGTPDAVPANDQALASRKPTAEQPTTGAIAL